MNLMDLNSCVPSVDGIIATTSQNAPGDNLTYFLKEASVDCETNWIVAIHLFHDLKPGFVIHMEETYQHHLNMSADFFRQDRVNQFSSQGQKPVKNKMSYHMLLIFFEISYMAFSFLVFFPFILRQIS